jgi:hypothetical protein
MGASSLRAQEPQLMRSPGEPLQFNKRSFGCMIELAVIGHRPRARSSSDASPRPASCPVTGDDGHV